MQIPVDLNTLNPPSACELVELFQANCAAPIDRGVAAQSSMSLIVRVIASFQSLYGQIPELKTEGKSL